MNINQIKYFVSVFELGSFSKAAQEQFVTVQAVSKSINDLEHETELQFFTRSSNGVIPTALGKSFYKKAKVALSSFQELESFTEDDSLSEEELFYRVALCAPEFNQYQKFCQSLADFVKQNIDFEVDFNVINPDLAQKALETGEVDALITIGTYENKKTECISLGTLPTGIIIAPNHPLASKDVIAREDLAAYPAAMSPTFDGFNDSIMMRYRNNKFLGDICLIEDQDEIPHFLADKHGYYFSAIISQPKELRPNTMLKPIDPKNAIRIPICFVTLKNDDSKHRHQLETFLLRAVDFCQW